MDPMDLIWPEFVGQRTGRGPGEKSTDGIVYRFVAHQTKAFFSVGWGKGRLQKLE
jgi:hypothetical protein